VSAGPADHDAEARGKESLKAALRESGMLVIDDEALRDLNATERAESHASGSRPGKLTATFMLVHYHQQLGNLETATAYAKELVHLMEQDGADGEEEGGDPPSRRAVYEMVRDLAADQNDAGDYEDARALAAAAIGLEPEDPSSHYVLGLALEGLGRLDEAQAGGVHELLEDLDSGSVSFATALAMGVVLREAGRFDDALTLGNQLQERADTDRLRLRVHNFMATVLELTGDLDGAAEQARAALDIVRREGTAEELAVVANNLAMNHLLRDEPRQALELVDANQPQPGAQPILSGHHIIRGEALLKLGDLVTLSACESGVNEHRPGDELIGLTRALIYAGTPSVIVSLWRVDDLSAGLLMRGFYERLLRPTDAVPVTKANALQAAQIEVMRWTAGQVVADCTERLNTVTDNNPERRILLELELAGAHATAGTSARPSTSVTRWLSSPMPRNWRLAPRVWRACSASSRRTPADLIDERVIWEQLSTMLYRGTLPDPEHYRYIAQAPP